MVITPLVSKETFKHPFHVSCVRHKPHISNVEWKHNNYPVNKEVKL